MELVFFFPSFFLFHLSLFSHPLFCLSFLEQIWNTGSILLEFVLNKICKERPHIKQVYLHVQVSNDVAIEFYKKFGFEVGKKIENYYRRIEPADCFLVQKDL